MDDITSVVQVLAYIFLFVASNWDEFDGSDCDLLSLPMCNEYPVLPSEKIVIERLEENGVLIDDNVRDAMLASNRSLALWPLPSGLGIPGLAASALTLPWWKYADERGALLPGHYETVQIMQLLQMENNEKVLLVGPRGNWWTELILRLGASEICIIDADEERRNFLENNWKERDLDILAADLDCHVEFHGINRVKISDIEENGEEWDRILVTGACQEFPRRLMRRLSGRGVGVVSVGPEGASLIKAVTPNEEGGLFVESVTMWAADELDPRIYRSISDIASSGGLSDLQLRAEIGEASRDNSWIGIGDHSLRDRAGPIRLLEAMDQLWVSMEIDCDSTDLDAVMADRLFRMGNIMQNIGMFEYAAEHFGASYNLRPSAEAATMIGWTYGIRGEDEEAMGWCRRAIETDSNLGDPWNDIGALLLSKRKVEDAMAWFRAAINAERSLSPGHPWSNMARAHLMQRNSRAAFFAAQQAILYMPEDGELLMLLDELGSDLC